MKILIVDTFYGPYLEQLYASHELIQQPWAVQHKAHFAGGFGTGDAYSHGLGLLGVEAIEIVANSIPLQRAWAQGYRPDLLQLNDPGQQLFAILEAQIRWFEPSVLYVQDINWLPAGFLQHVKAFVEMVVGQNACPLASDLDLSPYDLLLTSLPDYVGRFRSMGVKAAYFPIGFDERLLQRHRVDGSRPNPLTFVGGLGGYHTKGTQMLEAIAKELPLQVWGYGGQHLPSDSMLRQRWKGEAWAEDMYKLLASSQITINRHIDMAGSYACNMRLYEATGMGACLVTEHKANIADLFDSDREIITFSSSDEAVVKIKELVGNPRLAKEIAHNGQLRTLKEHTYSSRMRNLLDILCKHSRLKDPSIDFENRLLVSSKIHIPVFASANMFPLVKVWADHVRCRLGRENVSFYFLVDQKIDALGEKVWMPLSPHATIPSLVESFFNCIVVSGFALVCGLRSQAFNPMQQSFYDQALNNDLLVKSLKC